MKKAEPVGKMKKDLARVIRRKYDMEEFEKIVAKLQNGEALDRKYKNYKLNGNLSKYYELHIEPDWLLIYQSTDEYIYLVRTGTHSDLYTNY